MKPLLYIFFLLSCLVGLGQSHDKHLNKTEKTQNYIEFVALPFVAYNKIEIGLSKKISKKHEHAIYASSSMEFLFSPSFNMNMSYNFNRYIKEGNNYVPFWFRVSNTRNEVGYEDGYYPHTYRYSIGSGVGKLFQLSNKLFLRTELGIGVSLNLTNSSYVDNYDVFPLKFNFQDYKIDQNYPKYYPPIIPAIRIKIDFVHKRTPQNNV